MEMNIVRDGKTVCRSDDPTLIADFINRHPKEKQKEFEVGVRMGDDICLTLIPARQLLFRGIVGARKIEKMFKIAAEVR